MMTPERRAEIERIAGAPLDSYDMDVGTIREGDIKSCFTHYGKIVMARELLAEIDRLNKVVDQAIVLYGIHGVGGKANRPKYPELAAELERRSKA